MLCQARYLERRVLWLHLPGPGSHAQGSGMRLGPSTRRPFILTYPFAQTKSGELANNFISGAVGGFVGTAVNTPCASTRSSPCATD